MHSSPRRPLRTRQSFKGLYLLLYRFNIATLFRQYTDLSSMYLDVNIFPFVFYLLKKNGLLSLPKRIVDLIFRDRGTPREIYPSLCENPNVVLVYILNIILWSVIFFMCLRTLTFGLFTDCSRNKLRNYVQRKGRCMSSNMLLNHKKLQPAFNEMDKII